MKVTIRDNQWFPNLVQKEKKKKMKRKSSSFTYPTLT